MNISAALTATMDEFGLTGTDLVTAAGITNSRLSRFLNGTAIKTDGLDKLIDALDDEAFRFLIEKLISARGMHFVHKEQPALSDLVERLDETATAELLNALAEKIRKGTTGQDSRRRELVST